MFQGARGKAARRPSEEAAGASALYSEEEYGEFRAQARFQSDDEARLKSQPNHGPYGGARGALRLPDALAERLRCGATGGASGDGAAAGGRLPADARAGRGGADGRRLADECIRHWSRALRGRAVDDAGAGAYAVQLEPRPVRRARARGDQTPGRRPPRGAAARSSARTTRTTRSRTCGALGELDPSATRVGASSGAARGSKRPGRGAEAAGTPRRRRRGRARVRARRAGAVRDARERERGSAAGGARRLYGAAPRTRARRARRADDAAERARGGARGAPASLELAVAYLRRRASGGAASASGGGVDRAREREQFRANVE